MGGGGEGELTVRVEEQSGFGDKGCSPPLSPTGGAAEASSGGEPFKCGVEDVGGVVDHLACLSEGLLAVDV